MTRELSRGSGGPAGTILRAAGRIPVARCSSAALDGELLREVTDLMMSRVRDQSAELRDEPAPGTFHPGPGRDRTDGVPGSAA